MSHMNMAGMAASGGALGGMALMNNGTNGTTPRSEEENDFEARLNTHIYGFFLKSENYDCARALLDSGVNMEPPVKRRNGDMNGIDDAMQTDSKDDIDSKRPSDLPPVPGSADQPNFLLDWYSCFWDFFLARTKPAKATPQAMQYMQHTQQQSRYRQEQQQHLLRGGPSMMPNGIDSYQYLRFQHDNLRQKALQNNNRNAYQPTPAQLVQMKNQQMAQHQMRRDPSDLDINGQRPRTPSSGDNAPSPSKRPRLDGPFAQQMIPNGRGPPQGLQGQPMIENPGNLTAAMLMQSGIEPSSLSNQQIAAFQSQPLNVQQKTLNVYAQNRPNQPRQSVSKPGMQGQGSPMMPQTMDIGNGTTEYFGGIQMRGGSMPNGVPGNHALQDYQMQLMMLEQQNKKRLLLARQEQDGSRPEGQAGIAGGPGYGAVMSPQESRSGPSPGPNDQIKRVSPKMGPSGMPGGGSPIPDGTLSRQGGSPAPMNYPGQMAPEMLQQMKIADGMGPVGPNGMRPQNPAQQFNGVQCTPQQMEAYRARSMMGPVPNGTWPQAPPGQAAMMQQPAPPQQPSQIGTPQPRSMPPPTIPTGAPTTGRPASPAQPANPPSTPSQTNKPNPSKTKKDRKDQRKQPQKKPAPVGPANSTPATDAENQPPTPIPSTPITPMAPASFSQPGGGGQSQAGTMQGVPSAAHTTAPAQQPPDANPIAQFPVLEENGDYSIGPFSNDITGDVLENFDFDSFLQSTDDGGFQFDAFGMPGEGVEAAAGDQ